MNENENEKQRLPKITQNEVFQQRGAATARRQRLRLRAEATVGCAGNKNLMT